MSEVHSKGGVDAIGMANRSNEAENAILDLNAQVDKLKQLNDKDAATGLRIAAQILDRVNAMGTSNNPHFLAVSGKMFSVVNRLMALGGSSVPMEQIQTLSRQQAGLYNQIQTGLANAQSNGQFVSPEDRMIMQEALKGLTTSLTETTLLSFKGTPKDFFENPQYKQLAVAAVDNYMSINPEQTAMIKDLTRSYALANNEKVPQDFKLEPVRFNGHAGFSVLTAQGERTRLYVYVD